MSAHERADREDGVAAEYDISDRAVSDGERFYRGLVGELLTTLHWAGRRADVALLERRIRAFEGGRR